MMFPRSTTPLQRARSSRSRVTNRSVGPPAGVAPSVVSRSFTSASPRISLNAACSRATIGAGVRAGTAIPVQMLAVKPATPASIIVGTSGSGGNRSGEVTPSTRNLLASPASTDGAKPSAPAGDIAPDAEASSVAATASARTDAGTAAANPEDERIDARTGKRYADLTDEDMPPLESLGPESDYSMFMARNVSSALRNRALKRLFAAPEFNRICLCAEYAEDYTNFTPLGGIVPHDMARQIAVNAERAARKLAEAGKEALGRVAGADDAGARTHGSDATADTDTDTDTDTAMDSNADGSAPRVSAERTDDANASGDSRADSTQKSVVQRINDSPPTKVETATAPLLDPDQRGTERKL